MKKIFFVLTVFLAGTMTGCAQSQGKSENTGENPKYGIEFNETKHDFGKITYQGDGSVDFEFTNTGTAPLMINNVTSSCGCTIPKWTKEPVQPGEKGKISVKYDTKRVGPFSKPVRVYSNATETPITLTITGTVEAPQSQN